MRFFSLLTTILCTTLLCITTQIHAQNLSKEELKRLKADISALAKNPEKYKKMKDDNDKYNQQIMQQRKKLEEAKNIEIAVNKTKEDKVLEEHAKDMSLTTYKNNTTDSSGKIYANTKDGNRTENVVYRVQIGNYRNPEIQNFLDKNPDSNNFLVEDGGAGKRYILGDFPTQEEARSLSNLFRNTGGQSFVVAYRNGKRLNNLKELKKK